MEIDKALSISHLMMILQNIENYQWQGFSEKEEALNLAIKCFDKYTNFITDHDNEYTLKAKVVNIVNDVGFPCQNIFNAHIKKLMVRKPEFIIETIQNPKSKHFSEIWVLLSTGSFSMFDNETIKDLINAYKISIKNRKIEIETSESFYKLYKKSKNRYRFILNIEPKNIVIKDLTKNEFLTYCKSIQ